MKILFVVPYVPDLIRVRPYNLITHLAGRGNEITLVTLYSSEDEKAELAQLKEACAAIHAFPLTRSRSLLNSLLALPSALPLQSVYCWQPAMAAELRQLAGSCRFDVVHVEHLRGARFGLEVLAAQGVQSARERHPLPVVWDSVDCISMLFKQAAHHSKRRFFRWVTRFDLRRTSRYEGRLVNQFDKVLVTSKNDRTALMSLAPLGTPEDQVVVLPNGVDVDYFAPPQQTTAREDATLVISGKMSYHANVTMSLKFVEETMPIIWQRKKDARLVLVGKDPAPELRGLAKNPAIEVTGTVEDIRPYLHRATLAVAPITYGAGIQNKVLEAMACGLPVVTSPQAVSALAVTPGQDLIVANGPEDFANAVVALLDDPALRSRIGQAGRRYVEKQHLWANIAARLEEVYDEVIQGSRLTNE